MNVILPFLWSNYYGTGLVWLLFPLKVSLRLFLSWKKMPHIRATKSASYIHHAGSTFLHWFSLYHHHCLKSWRNLPTVHTLLRLLMSEPREWLQWLPKLPNLGKERPPLPAFTNSQSCQWMQTDARERVRGLCWSPGVQFNESKVPGSSHICPPKKRSARVYTKLSTVVFFYYSGTFSFFVSVVLWFYSMKRFWFCSRTKKHIFNLKNKAF